MRISVGVCTYNGEAYLRQQLDSILQQTVPVDEIIICDDASSDNTYAILEEYRSDHPKLIRIKRNPKNLKSIKNFEQVLSLCSGDIIFLSDQDDIWASNKVEEYIRYFADHPDVQVLCSNGHIIDQEDTIIDAITIWDVPHILAQRGEKINYFYSICYCGNIATGAAMAIKKDYLPHVLPIPDGQEMHHDEWIALTASFQNAFALLNEKLFYYRVHPHQQIGGTSYPNTARSVSKLYRRFLTSDHSVSSLKRRMKKAALTYHYLMKVKDISDKRLMRKEILTSYQHLKKRLIAYHPILGRMIYILEKRKIKEYK